MSHTLWTTFILYGSLQGFILAIIVYFKDRSTFLALFFGNIAYLLFIYLFERFEWFRDYPHLIWTNVPSWFLIGPLLYLYVEQLFTVEKLGFTIKKCFHFLPALGAFLFLSDFYLSLSGPEKIAAFTSFYTGEPIIDYMQMGYLLQITIYLYAGHRLIKRKTNTISNEISNSDFVHLRMVRKLFMGIGGYIVLAIILSTTLSLSFVSTLTYFQFVFAALASTVLIATIFYLYHSVPPHHVDLQSIAPRPTTILDNNIVSTGDENADKYATSSLSSHEKSVILERLQRQMKKHESYKIPDLKISDLADEMDIPSHHISQCLNQELGKNFFEYINSYRVEAVKQQLREGRHQQLTLFAIAQECGFNSQSSFYRIFKDATGATPSGFIDQSISS